MGGGCDAKLQYIHQHLHVQNVCTFIVFLRDTAVLTTALDKNRAQLSGRTLCPLCCLLHPHLHPTQFFQPLLPALRCKNSWN